ncbi:MAG: dihydroorotase [Dehalococcoidales bacterium]|nr:dihydroorotase [Dehalococcoidales bacterium]
MKPLLILDGRIIDPAQGIDEIGSLVVAEGQISWLGKGDIPFPPAECRVLHAQGLIVCPGFIDLHCHLRQPGFEDKETIATATRAAARGGFTTVGCMPNTKPPLDNPATIDYVKSTAESDGVIRVLPIGCVTKERKGQELVEMDKLAAAGVVGFSDDGDPVADSRLMRQALERSRDLNLPIIDHCEDKALSEGGQMNEGLVSAELGLRGIPNAAEEIIVARDLALAKLTGGWLHIAHASTTGSVELVRQAKESGVRVTAEVTPHHLTLTEAEVRRYGTNAKVNPPLRTQQDIEALVQGLNKGVIDIIATDHAPHTLADKQCQFTRAASGISGLETAFGSLMGLVHGGLISLTTLISKMTVAPAGIIGQRYGKLGSLAAGSGADVAILDPDLEWVVDAQTFASKGKNTPLDGSKLKGKVVATISRGELVYLDRTTTVGE